MNENIERIKQQIRPLQEELQNHNVYYQIQNLEDLQIFTEYHVFAVWDFMSLLKALQKELTCLSVPWFPKCNPRIARFINQMVLREESDIDQNGQAMSHFELYLKAMQEIGANTSRIELLSRYVERGIVLEVALDGLRISKVIKEFVQFTFDVINTRQTHRIAAAFIFGRENLVPTMFTQLVQELRTCFPERVETLLYYMERHTDVDPIEQEALINEILLELCGDDEEKWQECLETAKMALQTRIDLWNDVFKTIPQIA